MSKLEEDFDQRWKRLYPDCPLERGGVGSFTMAVGAGPSQSQIDFFSPEAMLIIEINGATYKGKSGAHSSGPGLRRDYVKQIIAQMRGWAYIELDSTMIKDKHVLDSVYTLACYRKTTRAPIPNVMWADWKHLLPKTKSTAKAKIKSTANPL